jgi:hypothetical protein
VLHITAQERFLDKNLSDRLLDSFLWVESDQAWRGDASWQEQIPRAIDPMVVAVVCLFGERLGEPLPDSFVLPPELVIPEMVQVPGRAINRE